MIRAFDLGGSGLKTQLFIVHPDGIIRPECDAPRNMGRCPINRSLRDWLLEHFRDEWESRKVMAVGFSLAGKDKMFNKDDYRRRDSYTDTAGTIDELTNIYPQATFMLHDSSPTCLQRCTT